MAVNGLAEFFRWQSMVGYEKNRSSERVNSELPTVVQTEIS